MNNIMTELQAALRAAGHGAEEVQNAPVDLLNVWLNDEGRIPAATVRYDPEGDGQTHGAFEWGHHWEHSISTGRPMDEIVQTIIATSLA